MRLKKNWNEEIHINNSFLNKGDIDKRKGNANIRSYKFEKLSQIE